MLGFACVAFSSLQFASGANEENAVKASEAAFTAHIQGGADYFSLSIRSAPLLCLDLPGGNTKNGNKLQIWECNGAESQLWYFKAGTYMLQYGGDATKCVDAGSTMKAGTQLMIWDCNKAKQQKWGYDSKGGAIYLASSTADASLCMDLAGGGTQGGTAVQVWSCNNLWEQSWNVLPGIGIRVGSNYQKCFDLYGGGTDNGNPVNVWDCNGLINQHFIFADWQIKYAGNTNKCIDSGGMKAGGKLQLWDCNGSNQQIWGYDAIPGFAGTIFLAKSTSDATYCIDLPGGSDANGNRLQIWNCNNCWNQQFTVVGPAPSLGVVAMAHAPSPSADALQAASNGKVELGSCPSHRCPYVKQEDDMENYLNQRDSLYYSGEIQKQIAEGRYTADTLSSDMYRWWVQDSLANHAAAIDQFTTLMQSAKDKVKKDKWTEVVLAWADALEGAVPGVSVITKAIFAYKAAVTTWKAAVSTPTGDFLSCALQFRSQLPTQQTTQLLAVNNFINGIKELDSSQYRAGLLEGYWAVTQIIKSTMSYRVLFNQYYSKFLEGAGLEQPWLHLQIESKDKKPNRIAVTVPGGVDSCTVANFLVSTNEGCVSAGTPGLEGLKVDVQIVSMNWGWPYQLMYDCSNLDLNAYWGCFSFGGPAYDHKVLPRDDSNCQTQYKVATDDLKSKGKQWPPQEANDFCTSMITSKTKYYGCNYAVNGAGAATCSQFSLNDKSCNQGFMDFNSTALYVSV
jgi:hypothetical protein